MRKRIFSVVDDMNISRLALGEGQSRPSFGHWIRLLRLTLKMTQVDLAKRAGVAQSHIAALEGEKLDPQISTLQKVFTALNCGLVIEPRPNKRMELMLRDQARAIALRRLKRTMGTMALEDQAPDGDAFRKLLEKKTDEILADQTESLWRSADE